MAARATVSRNQNRGSKTFIRPQALGGICYSVFKNSSYLHSLSFPENSEIKLKAVDSDKNYSFSFFNVPPLQCFRYNRLQKIY